MAIPKRLMGCKGCIYLNVNHAVCDYSRTTGKSRVALKAPLLPGGGCRLYEAGDKVVLTSMYSRKAEKRRRVVMPNGKIRYMKEDEYIRYKQEERL